MNRRRPSPSQVKRGRPHPSAHNANRAATALAYRMAGWAYRKIGEELGVGPERASQLVAKGRRARDREIHRWIREGGI